MARSVPRHDRDAGGDPRVLAAKRDLRREVWDRLQAAGVTRFPGAAGRIPNFVGAEAAAAKLATTAVWRKARRVKANPDAPQWPVRQRALEEGKIVYMAVPRLAQARPFFMLDPGELRDPPRVAASIKGASRSARTVDIDELEPVDLVLSGCVAVGRDGRRLGKGGGFGDLEFAIASAAGLIGRRTVVVTTVHELQVMAAGRIPTTGHDAGVDLIVTPERVIETERSRRAAPAIRWDELTDEKISAIPLLGRLAAAPRTE
jgi:5-formyltetrahydrofolate cyclo-ligase